MADEVLLEEIPALLKIEKIPVHEQRRGDDVEPVQLVAEQEPWTHVLIGQLDVGEAE